jgi:hypothetical protein
VSEGKMVGSGLRSAGGFVGAGVGSAVPNAATVHIQLSLKSVMSVTSPKPVKGVTLECITILFSLRCTSTMLVLSK